MYNIYLFIYLLVFYSHSPINEKIEEEHVDRVLKEWLDNKLSSKEIPQKTYFQLKHKIDFFPLFSFLFMLDRETCTQNDNIDHISYPVVF